MPQVSLSLSLFLILFGAIWFLKSTDILPATFTLIVIDLAVVSIIVMVFDGISKQSVASGLILIYAGAVVYLHMQYWVDFLPLVVLGTMVLGCMLLSSRSSIVPYGQDKQVKTDDGK